MQLGTNKKDMIHNLIYNKLDSWIAPLTMFKKSLTEHTSIPESKITVIPFGIELDRFSDNSTSKDEARKLLNLPNGSLTRSVLAGRIRDLLKVFTLIISAHRR